MGGSCRSVTQTVYSGSAVDRTGDLPACVDANLHGCPSGSVSVIAAVSDPGRYAVTVRAAHQRSLFQLLPALASAEQDGPSAIMPAPASLYRAVRVMGLPMGQRTVSKTARPCLFM